MMATRLGWITMAAIGLCAVVGAVDAAIGSTTDLLVLFVAIGALDVALVAEALTRRPSVRLRPDLARWLSQRAARVHDDRDRVADRAVAAYRAALVGDPDDEGTRA